MERYLRLSSFNRNMKTCGRWSVLPLSYQGVQECLCKQLWLSIYFIAIRCQKKPKYRLPYAPLLSRALSHSYGVLKRRSHSPLHQIKIPPPQTVQDFHANRAAWHLLGYRRPRGGGGGRRDGRVDGGPKPAQTPAETTQPIKGPFKIRILKKSVGQQRQD